MFISEVIEKLQKAQIKYGDLPIFLSTEDKLLAEERNEYHRWHTDTLDEAVVQVYNGNNYRMIFRSYDKLED